MTPQELAEAAFAAFNRGDATDARRLFEALLGTVPDWLPGRYGLGMACFQTGDYAQAAPLLASASAGGVGLPDSWTYHCHALAMLEHEDALVQALTFPADPRLKADLAFQIFNNRLAQGRRETVLPLAARIPDEPALLMPAMFWTGIALAGDDPEAAYRSFRAALGHAADLKISGVESPLVASHIAAGGGIETDGFVLEALDAAMMPHPPVVWHDPPTYADREHGVIFAAADGAYVAAFAADCIASLSGLGLGRTMHLHIVNPGDDLPAILLALRAAAPGLTLRISSEHAPDGDAVYYACARFLLLPTLLERYRTTVTVIDIDCLFQPRAEPLTRLVGDADAALFRLDTVFPWLQYPAAMVMVRDTAGGRRFAHLLNGFLRRKLLGLRSWTLDQAALFCVVGAVRRHCPDIALVTLHTGAGNVLDDLMRSQGSFAAKRALRLATAQP